MEPKPNTADFTFNGVLQQPHYDYAVRAWEKLEGREKSDCSKHKKDVADISDMKLLAEKVGDLHYETLTQFIYHLYKKIDNDAWKNYECGREKLASALQYAAMSLFESSLRIEKVWQISEPFMQKKD